MQEASKERFDNIMRAYHSLGDECLEALAAIARSAQFQKGETIVAQEKPCGNIFVIENGVTRVCFRKGDKEDTLCFGRGGDIFFSFHDWYSGEPPAFALEAVDYKVEGWWIPIRKFKELEERYPELYKWMQLLLVEQFYSIELLYRKLALATPAEKFDNFWHFLAPNLRNNPPKSLTRTLPLKFLAQYLGMTPQTLSKIRRKFVGR